MLATGKTIAGRKQRRGTRRCLSPRCVRQQQIGPSTASRFGLHPSPLHLEAHHEPGKLKPASFARSDIIVKPSSVILVQVVRFLKGEEGSIVELVGEESKEKVAKTPLFDGGEMDDDYTCSRYLRDLHRHKQLALEQ